MDINQFKGRKGQKRLKELNERIDGLLLQTDEYAAKSPEMEAILRSISDPLVKEYFVERYKTLDTFWGGIRKIGFLRLCVRWMKRKKITGLDRKFVDEMFMTVLPAEEMQQIRNAANGDR